MFSFFSQIYLITSITSLVYPMYVLYYFFLFLARGGSVSISCSASFLAIQLSYTNFQSIKMRSFFPIFLLTYVAVYFYWLFDIMIDYTFSLHFCVILPWKHVFPTNFCLVVVRFIRMHDLVYEWFLENTKMKTNFMICSHLLVVGAETWKRLVRVRGNRSSLP